MPVHELPEPLRRRLAALVAPRDTGWLPAAEEPAGGAEGAEPVHVAPRGRAALALVAVAALAVALVALRTWADRPRALPPPPAAAASTSPVAGLLVVDVEGAVARPGVQRLARGSRVADALAVARPARQAATAALNLARLLVDGEQLVVPTRGAPAAAGPGATGPAPASAAEGTSGGKVDLNSANAEQLQQLDGVGPVLAERIVQWRTEHGRFSSVEDLREVSGIGPRKYERLAAQVRV